MTTIRSIRPLFFFILLPLCCSVFVISCDKKSKEKEKETEIPKTNTKVSEFVLTEIAESNLKIVAIAQKAQERKMPNSTQTVLQQIEKNHNQFKNTIRKIAKDNYIIIPNTLYDTTTLKSFISEVSTSMYLKKLHNSLLAELELYKKTATTSLNADLLALTKEAIPIIQQNIASIQKEQKIHP